MCVTPKGSVDDLQKAEQSNNRMMRGVQAFPPPAGNSIPEQIEAPARLRGQGVISETEFETKKDELLRRM